jgi:hypothetical protein
VQQLQERTVRGGVLQGCLIVCIAQVFFILWCSCRGARVAGTCCSGKRRL